MTRVDNQHRYSNRKNPKRQPSLKGLTTGLILLLFGCASTSQSVPVNLEWSEQQSGADVASLSNPSAVIVEKCEQAIQTIQAASSDLSDYAALMSGLQHGNIPPAVWPQCASHVLKGLIKAGRAPDFLDRMGYAYQQLLRSDSLESNRRLQAELHALHQVFLSRPAGVMPRPAVVDELLDDLRPAVQKNRLGPVASRHGEDLLLEFDLTQGRWGGQPLKAPVLDALLEQKKEGLLRRIVARVADKSLRDEARRRIVRLHIAASAWPEVTTRAAEVESIVLDRGHFAVTLAEHPLIKGQISAQRSAVQAILVKQDVWRQLVSLVPGAFDHDKLTALSSFNLHDALILELRGLSHPVSLCAPAAELDVTPCLEASEMHFSEPIATLDSDGRVHFAENIPIATLVDWLRQRPELSFAIEIGGRTLMGLSFPVSFSLPESLDFTAKAGEPGPDLDVRVEAIDAQRILLTATSSGKSYLALLDREQALDFSVVSQGGAGKPGSRGSSGKDGTSGEAGAPGGAIEVQVVCATDECGGLPYLARKLVESQGGSGGVGGNAGDAVRLSANAGGGGRRRGGGGRPQQQQGKRGARGAVGPSGHINVVIVKPH